MALHFSSGDIELLKNILNKVVSSTAWEKLNESTFRAKMPDGSIVNYFSTTGRLSFQGKYPAHRELEKRVAFALQNEGEVEGGDQSASSSEAGSVAEAGLPPVEKENEQTPNGQEGVESPEPHHLSEGVKGTGAEGSEVVIALIGAIGVEYREVVRLISSRLRYKFGFEVNEIRVSKDIIANLPGFDSARAQGGAYKQISYYMERGNEARRAFGDNSILAKGAACIINRDREPAKRKAFIVNSLKHPDEINFLRDVYGKGFYLVGVFADNSDRHAYLTGELEMSLTEAEELMRKDKDSEIGHGAHTRDAFHLSDYFVYLEDTRNKIKANVNRLLDIMFGFPYSTPTFDEYCMFTAFTSALRSADLSRQVGAVISQGQEIIATGANDTPKAGGGLYWPLYDNRTKSFTDYGAGRDYMRGYDSNSAEKSEMAQDIFKKIEPFLGPLSESARRDIKKELNKTKIKDLTEYGRVVHAEMEALMVCARTSVSALGATIYCTTFPCHNCAKHIIASGIRRVVYIEPYPKSKALEFHSEAVVTGFKPKKEEKDVKVYFEPFVGLGPRKFFDMFSMSLGSGRSIKRKLDDGRVVEWNPKTAPLKTPLVPTGYVEKEKESVAEFVRKTGLTL